MGNIKHYTNTELLFERDKYIEDIHAKYYEKGWEYSRDGCIHMATFYDILSDTIIEVIYDINELNKLKRKLFYE